MSFFRNVATVLYGGLPVLPLLASINNTFYFDLGNLNIFENKSLEMFYELSRSGFPFHNLLSPTTDLFLNELSSIICKPHGEEDTIFVLQDFTG